MTLFLYILAMLASFYLLPLLAFNTVLAVLILVILIPAIIFGCAFLCGVYRGFAISIPIITSVLFVPSAFIFFDIWATACVVIYAAAALVGNMLGEIYHKKL